MWWVPVELHSPSILLTGSVIGLVGCVILARCRSDHDLEWRLPIRGIWLSAALLLTAACFGNALRPLLDAWVVFGPLNALTITPFGLLWLGARRLVGHRDALWWAALPPVIWLAASALPGFTASFTLRVTLIVPLITIVLGGACVQLYGLYQREGVRSANDLAAMLIGVVAWLWVLLVKAIAAPPTEFGNWGFVGPLTALLIALVTGALPLMMVTMAREIAVSRETTARLVAMAEGRAEISRLHEGLPAIIFLRAVTADGSSRILYRGGDVVGVTGLPITAMRDDGLPVQALPTAPALFVEHCRDVLRDGAGSMNWHLTQPDGSKRVLRTVSRVLRWLPDGDAEVVGYTKDVTVEFEAEVRSVAAARLAAIGEMGKGLAHEIKQPLQAISLAADLVTLAVRNGQLGTIEARMDVIVDEAARAAQIVEHLRLFASDAGDAAPVLPIDLTEVLKTALGLTGHSLDEAGVTVEVSLGKPVPVPVGHEIGLAQVLVHLIMNARDAMLEQPPNVPRRLLIGASSVGQGLVTLTVSDTGGGIEAAMLPRLFTPFVTTKDPDRGRGVGLAASYALVRAMGGKITARNETDGAVIVITLSAPPP